MSGFSVPARPTSPGTGLGMSSSFGVGGTALPCTEPPARRGRRKAIAAMVSPTHEGAGGTLRGASGAREDPLLTAAPTALRVADRRLGSTVPVASPSATRVRRILLSGLAVLLPPPGEVRAQIVLWEQTGPVGAEFGSRLARTGDTDGDGVWDLIAAARTWGGASGPAQFTGKAFLLSGATGGVLLEWTGPAPLAYFGTTVAGPGDVDGDGTSDVAVGTLWSGAFVYSGSDGALLFSIAGGSGIGGPGDIDGDGYADIAAAVTASPGVPAAAHVYSGADGSLLLNLNIAAGA